MPRFVLLLSCVLITVANQTACAAADLRPFTTAQIEALGRALFEIERRTEIAVDLMNENYDPEEEKIGAWVTEGDPPNLLVRFVRLTDNGAEPVLDATFDNLLLPSFSTPSSPSLTTFQQSQIAARQTVQAHLQTPCSRHYESVALADPTGPGLLLYALALEEEPSAVLLGGHHRFSLSVDGQTLRQADALSTACTATTLAKLQATDASQGVAIRANLSDTPLEIHVYLSLHYRVPLFVVTRDLKMWEVKDGHMRVISERPGAASSAAAR
jgi:hypothetical protein